jgi:hypothetical protein
MMNAEAVRILTLELDSDDGLIVTFSDETTGAYVVEELLALGRIGSRVPQVKRRSSPNPGVVEVATRSDASTEHIAPDPMLSCHQGGSICRPSHSLYQRIPSSTISSGGLDCRNSNSPTDEHGISVGKG